NPIEIGTGFAFWGLWRSVVSLWAVFLAGDLRLCSSGVEHFLGKEEVRGSNPLKGSKVLSTSLVRKRSGTVRRAVQIPSKAQRILNLRDSKKQVLLQCFDPGLVNDCGV